MRILLTCLAILIVAALSAASIAPLFIDWSAWRGPLAAELTRRIGAPVEIAGPIELRLLPTPYVRVGEVRVGADGAHRWLDCASMRFELALGGLFGGRLEIDEATLQRPVIHVGAGAFAPLASLGAGVAARAAQFAFDRIVVEHGSLTVDRASGAPISLQDLALDASASSLLGPFRGSGSFATTDGGRTQFQFASAETSNGRAPIKAEISRGRGGPRAEFDGQIAWAPGPAAGPIYQGRVAVAGSLPEPAPGAGAWPWRAEAALRAVGGGARFDDLRLEIGQDARAVEATGKATLVFGASLDIDATLAAKQVNLDALLRGEREVAVSPARFFAASAALAEAAWRSGAPPAARLRLNFATPQIFLGAGVLDNVSLSLSARPGAPVAGELRAGLPGQSHVHLKGQWELGPAPLFRGEADGEVGDFGALRQWASLDQPDLGERLASLEQALPSGVARGSGEVELSPAGVSVRGLELTIDRSRFAGAMAFTRATADQRGRLFLDLSSDALDIEVAPNLEAASQWLGDIDLSLSFVASKLRVARLGRSSVEGGSLSLKATKEGARLSLDELSMHDLGGATIEAQGQSSPAGRWGRLKVDAAQLRDFASLVAKAAPGRLSDWLMEHADGLSPAKATLEARRDGPPLEGVFPLDFIRTDGEAAASRFSVRLSRAPAPVDAIVADVTVDAADGAALLRQIGAKAPTRPAGRTHLSLNASGLWETGFDASASASLAGADLAWRGRLSPAAPAGDPVAVGPATLKSPNLLDAFAALGFGAAESPSPADLSADVVARADEIGLEKVAGTVAGSKLSGHIAWRAPSSDPAGADPDIALARALSGDAQPPRTALSGELSLDRATAGALAALALGATPPARNGTPWSDAKFAAPLVSPPPTDLRLTIGTLDGVAGTPMRNVSTRMRIDLSGVDFNDIDMQLGGAGKATGRLVLRRDGPLAAMTGQVALQSVEIARPALRAGLSGEMEFAGTGASASALVAGLAGQGQFRVQGLTLPRLDPDALARVLAKAEGPDAQIDETNLTHALGAELDRRPTAPPEFFAPASLSSGQLRIGPVELPAEFGDCSLSVDFDLRNATIDIGEVLRDPHVGKFWSGPPPSASVALHGTLDGLSRRIDASSLAAGLAAEAIGRESERIAALEADMRERAAFNRHLKAWRFLDRRQAEIEAYEAEQERAKDEAERKRLTAEYLRFYDDYARSHDSGIDDLVKGMTSSDVPHLARGAGFRTQPSPDAPGPMESIREHRRE